MKSDADYSGTCRPQFHFTAKRGWLNDPNGLVFYEGEYHLCFQHNPFGTNWSNMTWGHAVSSDLVHWEQLPNAIEPDTLGTIWSGSAVVDWNNTAGFQTGSEKPLVAIYTAGGDRSPESNACTQCLAYSNDRGRTWNKFGGNPVIKNISHGNRDPKVFWHTPTQRWVMALYAEEKGATAMIQTVQFFASPDLKRWVFLSKLDGFYECPDVFELAVDGDSERTRWVLFAADGCYVIGQFDGRQFVTESGKHTGDWGANFYAAQTFSDIPTDDGRRILMGWMRGGSYPEMPFNQQMTFPCELRLRTFPEGIRVCKTPVSEISRLYNRTHRWTNILVKPGENPLAGILGDLFDIEVEIDPGGATEVGFYIRHQKVSYVVGDKELNCLGKNGPAIPGKKTIRLRVLVDRTSLEVFGNAGRVALSSCILPNPDAKIVEFFTSGGAAKIVSLRLHELRPAWS